MTSAAHAKALETWLCPVCGAPRPRTGPLNIQIEESQPEDSPLSFVSGCGVQLVHRAFLHHLGAENVERDLQIGALYNEQGRPLANWVTLRGRAPIIVRGSQDVAYRECGYCGRHSYFAIGAEYLCPRPHKDSDIFEVDFNGLVVTKRVYLTLDLSTWPQLVAKSIPVLETPLDSLPVDLLT